MVTPIPAFPNQSPSTATFFGSLSKLFLFDSRLVGPAFVRWTPERLPNTFNGSSGAKVYFHPETAAVSLPASSTASGSSTTAEIIFETIDDSPEVLSWLTALMEVPLFALTYPVAAGMVRGFHALQLTFEYKNSGEYASAPRYAVALKPKGPVKVWYTEAPVPTGGNPGDPVTPGPVLPPDPDEPIDPTNPTTPPPIRAFSSGFGKGFK